MAMSGQIPIQFPEQLLSFDELTITAANRGPISAIRRAELWPYHVFCLVGSPRSGRTTLAQAWVKERSGTYLTAETCAALSSADIDAMAGGSVAVDEADATADDGILLTMIGAFERSGGRLLLTAGAAPARWQTSSPDLASRLRSAPIGSLGAPDEELMRARIRRACERAYMKLPDAVEDYLVTRLGLDFALIESTISDLNGAMGVRPLTVPLAREVLKGNT